MKKYRIKWFIEGEWERYDLSREDPHTFSCKTRDEAQIRLKLNQENGEENGPEDLYVLDVTVTPNQYGIISGVQLLMPLEERLECSWKPHLAPMEGMTIGDKVFRSPAMIFEDESVLKAVLPDLSVIKEKRIIPHIMDYTLDEHSAIYGICDYEETDHVYYRMTPKKHDIDAPLSFRLYLARWEKEAGTKQRDFRPVENLLWEKVADQEFTDVDQQLLNPKDLETYAHHTYDWAFKNWKSLCWQEFKLGEKDVGGVVFIVTAKQKPGLGQEDAWREPKSLWNQAWFCCLRSGYGYWQWGDRWGQEDLKDKGEKVLEFTLSAPQINGLFPSNYQAGKDNCWETGKWNRSSDRRPEGHEAYVHLLDSSWTCYWLLKWYRDLKKDSRILSYVHSYVNRLLSLQFQNGSFPAWVRPEDLNVSPYLTESPESAVHVMLLCLLNEIEPNPVYIKAAKKTADFLTEQIISEGRWEDFETYWSCSSEWAGKQYSKPDKRSGLYNQCNLGIYWTAEALKELYRATGISDYLRGGEQALAELSLYQQVWQPPFFDVPTIGGFGVMNSDDEWNDARQSLFALTYMDYYQLTGNERYKLRGLWAMKASFYMMYCPENPEVKKLYEKVHPHFNEEDFGFNMENFNHHDSTETDGIGEFTIFDWGNGAASASLAEFIAKEKNK